VKVKIGAHKLLHVFEYFFPIAINGYNLVWATLFRNENIVRLALEIVGDEISVAVLGVLQMSSLIKISRCNFNNVIV
jgi:hypothetical protein